ncbi:MAG TPA: phosphate propanoyltransferase [bacterium]|nr:phosphate propanoyltransferase [bacterium]
MVNQKGLASYCQGCGLCAVSRPDDIANTEDEALVDIIVAEVLKELGGIAGEVDIESQQPLIPLGVSNRHVHITPETFKRLFGDDVKLEKYRDLYQAGEFAARQSLTIVGNKMRAIQNVRILGPMRDYDQVELSLTDAIQLGINPPIRNSGKLSGAAPLTLVGPRCSVYLEECAIIANRHVHMPGNIAARFGVKNGDLIKVRIGGEKSTVFENVLVRVNDAWKLHLHLDTDDANAANVRCSMAVEFYGKM